jgi:hypothetical protein
VPIPCHKALTAALAAALLGAAASTAPHPASAAGTAEAAKKKPRTWHVSAAARAGGSGSRRRPLASLARVEAVSRAGDTILVLPGGPALDGGIALKPRQRLIGAGPRLVSKNPPARSARITNTTGRRYSGDAVRLADRVTVRNLDIEGAHRGAIYGLDVSGVKVEGNEVSAHNRSCAEGFLIPPFIAPTNVPGAGLPIAEGLDNGWAGIMIDARRRTGSVEIRRNLVRDSHCGDGIDLRLSGTAGYRAEITSNMVRHLQQGEELHSLLAIGLQTRDRSRLVARLDRNQQSDLGNPDDPNVLFAGADTEGIFVNPVGPSSIDVAVRRNTYTNARGLGGFSSNGMEMVSMGDGSRARMTIRDSSFSGSPGDILEEGGLGTNAQLDLTLENVVATRSVGFGNTGLLPFNNSDCLLAGSLGAGNVIRLTVRRSKLTSCANNGLSLGSNVVNGSGPTSSVQAEVSDSEISGNRGANLAIRNFTRLHGLAVKVERTNLSDSRGLGSGLANLSAEDLGATGSSVIDLGGGALGSRGDNCFAGGRLAADVVRYRVSAAGNWWGRPGGPGLGRTLVAGGLDTGAPLSAPAPACAAR